MIPPVFLYASGSPDVVSLLGVNPTRLWPFSDGPHASNAASQSPYALWQLVYGAPENNLSSTPEADNPGVQVDCYGRTASEARAVLLALRDAFEPHGHVTSYNGEFKEEATGLYRASFTVEFWEYR